MYEFLNDLTNLPKGFRKLLRELVTKPVAVLYEPTKHSRLEAAKAEAERRRLLSEAQTKRDIISIENGNLKYEDTVDKSLVLSADNTAPHLSSNIRSEPFIDMDVFAELCKQEDDLKKLNEQINKAECLKIAEEELTSTPDHQISDEGVNTDWFNEWLENSEKVTTEETRYIWGRILAGEIKKPGSYSVRTLNVLKHLSMDEALIFQRLVSVTSQNFCFRPVITGLLSHYIAPHEIMLMEEAGLLDNTSDNARTLTLQNNSKDSFKSAFKMGDKVLELSSETMRPPPTYSIFKLTSAGEQLLPFAFVEFNNDYIEKCREYFTQQGFTVRVAQIEKEEGSQFFYK
ncbi:MULTISPECIES: DUF2806 domain-containing protein [unclassified Alteromonas]|uniref:DUF2806 domain-containing protein n=1 Tax=unclassified Alteromonas TaxID=2614992 RepID=UPI0005097B91|nr:MULTISPECIES: DUF2806 domain-containing protein [unclassified Alteromonas]